MEPSNKTIQIEWQPLGLKTESGEDQTLLAAAQKNGLRLAAVCGGNGTCGACKVQRLAGELSPLSETEKEKLTQEEIASGFRLACKAKPLGNVKIHIPKATLLTEQRLQLEGESSLPDISDSARVIQTIDLTITEPTITDHRADSVRLKDALTDSGIANCTIHPALLSTLSDELRLLKWQPRAVLRGNEAVALFSPEIPPLGLAVDIGTTKIAAYLVDLATGQTLGRQGVMNPQIGYGEDVVSRIAYANATPDGRETLQHALIAALNTLIETLCEECGMAPKQIVESVVVCNTAIHHFFCNLPVRQLGKYPFIAAVSESLNLPATSFGLCTAAGAAVFIPECVAGYVGADHLAMLIGSGIYRTNNTMIAVDIGTNTEISLFHQGSVYCCSCASGPAFEGAHISCGMRASAGAIERLRISGKKSHYQTIGNQPPVGLCGSGILDAVAALRTSGIINHRGNFDPDFPSVRKAVKNYEYVIADETESASGKAITVTRADINEIILAKSAIRSGLEILMQTAGIQAEALDAFLVAGAFGTFLDVESAVAIGMFPEIPLEKFSQIGNAAGTGARSLLLSSELRKESSRLATRMTYVELSAYPDFNDILVSWMYL